MSSAWFVIPSISFLNSSQWIFFSSASDHASIYNLFIYWCILLDTWHGRLLLESLILTGCPIFLTLWLVNDYCCSVSGSFHYIFTALWYVIFKFFFVIWRQSLMLISPLSSFHFIVCWYCPWGCRAWCRVINYQVHQSINLNVFFFETAKEDSGYLTVDITHQKYETITVKK